MSLYFCCQAAREATDTTRKSASGQVLVAAIVLLLVTTFSVSCSSVSGQSTATATVPAVTVQITPPSANIAAAGSVQFSATVRGTSNPAVIWSTSQGTISSAGLFVAPKLAISKPIIVTATSVANALGRASAIVSLASTQLSIVSSYLPTAQTGVAYSADLQSEGGAAPYTWSVASGSLPSGLTLSSNGTITGTTSQAGTFSFAAKVADSNSQTASTTLNLSVTGSASGSNYTGFDGPAQLPLVYLQTAMADTPAPGSVIPLNAGGDLQSALNSAACGETIQLQAGAVFAGNFTVPATTCDDQHWIIVRTSTPDAQLPPEGTRMTPCYAGVASLPARPAYTCSTPQKLLATIELNKTGIISGPIRFLPGASHYRFVGLEITRLPGIGSTVDLMAMEDTSAGAADHIILDRVWVHGTAQDETRRGIALGSMSYIGIVDSYFSDFHCTAISGTCTDASDIGGGAGNYAQTVWKINDNFLEAAGESILLGGDPATVTPSDIEVRFNHFFKPLTWKKGSPGFVGGSGGNPFVVKNHFELKNGKRVLLEGNIFEDNWGGFTQNGHSIVLTPRNHYNYTTKIFDCNVCQVTDITIRYSTISHVGAGMNLSNPLSVGQPAAGGGRYSIHDITIDDVELSGFGGGGGLFLISNGWSTNELNNVQITHITAFPDPFGRILALLDVTSNPKMPGFVFTDNIVSVPGLPIFGAGGGSENCDTSRFPLPGLEGCFADYVFAGNVLIGSPADMTSQWPVGNLLAASPSTLGFVNYNNADGGDYTLSPSSPYKSASGPDPGADIGAINASLAGVY
jgi:Putative Ig domain